MSLTHSDNLLDNLCSAVIITQSITVSFFTLPDFDSFGFLFFFFCSQKKISGSPRASNPNPVFLVGDV